MGLRSYLTGCALLVVALVPVAWAAFRWRARLLPGWWGGPARLAEVVLASALFFAVLHVLGTVGLFARWPVVIALAVVGTSAALTAGRSQPSARTAFPNAVALGVLEAVAGALIVALVVAFWTPALRDSLLSGPVDIDTQSFHLPMALRFVQEGRLTRLEYIGADFHLPYYPYEVDLVHAFGVLVFGRDVLTPIANHGWLAALLGAAWTAGRRQGAAVATLAAGALALTMPNMSGSQPGAATTDTAGVFFLVAAVVVLLHDHERSPAAVAVAGASTGIAIGTKQAYIVASAVLTFAVLFDAWKRRRASVAWAWVTPLILTGGFWYARNLAHVGTPLPGLSIRVGPLELSGPPMRLLDVAGDRFVKYLFDAGVWRAWYLPQLRANLGIAWPLLLGLPVIACLVLFFRARDRMLRGVALSGVAILVAYVFTPTTGGGPERQPVLFGPTLRYLAPLVIIGAIAAARLVADARPRNWLWVGSLCIPLLLLNATTTRSAPGIRGWSAGLLVLFGSALVLAAARHGHRVVLVGGGAFLAVAAVAVGYVVQNVYVESRYTPAGNYSTFWPGFDEIAFRIQRVRQKRIGVAAAGANFNLQYALAGADLSNEIRYIGVKKPNGEFTEHTSCASWRRAINNGDFDYVVVQRPLEGSQAPPLTRWTRTDRATTLVADDADASLFDTTGTLDPYACTDDERS